MSEAELLKFPEEPTGTTIAPEIPAPETYPLSHTQQRLWVIDQLELIAGAAYHVRLILRLTGDLQIGALRNSLNALMARHAVLRSRFQTVDDAPVQIVDEQSTMPLTLSDLSGLDAAKQAVALDAQLRSLIEARFDLAQEPPVRSGFITLGPNEHVLAIVMHHIVADGWSFGVVMHDLAAFYQAYRSGQAPQLEPLPLQYADFARWQRRALDDESLQLGLDYWSKQLRDAPTAVELPTDRPRPGLPTFAGGTHTRVLPARLARMLTAFSRARRCTLFMTLFCALQILLFRWTGQSDLVVGTVVSGRDRAELEPLIGCFMNFMALRTRIAMTETGEALLRRVKTTVLAGYKHQDCPFDELVIALNPQRRMIQNPLFNVALLLQNLAIPKDLADGVTAQQLFIDTPTALLDLRFIAVPRGDELVLRIEYAAELFESDTVKRLLCAYEDVLQRLATAPQTPIAGYVLPADLPARRSAGGELTRSW